MLLVLVIMTTRVMLSMLLITCTTGAIILWHLDETVAECVIHALIHQMANVQSHEFVVVPSNH